MKDLEKVGNQHPRKKLIIGGRRSLTNAELLSITIGTGSQRSIELGQRVMDACNQNWKTLAEMTYSDLLKIQGVSPVTATKIIANLEIGLRRNQNDFAELPKVENSLDIFRYLKPTFEHLKYEEFWIIMMNRQNKIIGKKRISKGGVAGTVADLKIIFKTSLECLASSIIAAHNHPSLNTNPSQADKELTKKMVAGGKVIDIQVLDHMIVTSNGYYSFADEGYI